jgi:ADP-heptose:LPS heptosyltransferase
MRIGVLRALQLGDLLCTVPALRALRGLYPQAHITIIGLPWMKVFVERYPKYLDNFLHFPGYPSLPEQTVTVGQVWSFVKRQQEHPFDLLLQMQGTGKTLNPFMELWGADKLAGFYVKGNYKPGSLFCVYPTTGHEIERMLALTTFLGAQDTSIEMEFPLYSQDFAELQALSLGLAPVSYVCVHVGARDAQRRASLEDFARLAHRVHEKGYRVVLTGVKSEQRLVRRLAAMMDFEVIDVSGKTNLGVMGALLKQSRLLLANDTGISHLACALKVPSVILSLAPEPERWSALNRDLHTTIRAL